ncbi:unnamed protein product [Larinioides sclopetarius]|uniref:EGF-like domain-containing protein n=1 Tax=Larinioides sclopetarius TaxID=280406 RepID=A0AAV1ZTF3_9ARAC
MRLLLGPRVPRNSAFQTSSLELQPLLQRSWADLRLCNELLLKPLSLFWCISSKRVHVTSGDPDGSLYDTYAENKDIISDLLIKIEETLTVNTVKEDTLKNATHNSESKNNLKLPVFTGDLSSWLSFKEIFTNAIEKNSELSETAKLSYLISSLKGDPAKLISGFTISDENYKQAWETLLNLYDDKKNLANSLLSKFINAKPIKPNNEKSILDLLDTCNPAIRNLKSLKFEFVNLILVFIVQEKLDESLRKQWELSLDSEKFPTYDNLVSFIESHARSIRNSNSDHLNALCKPGCMNGGVCVAPNKCRCKPGYVGNSCNKAVCQYGCKNGGECVAPNKCVCRSGFSGKDCSQPHCDPACQNGGECVKPYFCHCPPGTRGNFCEKFHCKPDCQNGGICIGTGKCSCSRGYTGYNCEKAYCPGGCLNGGKCGKTGKCLCPLGFTGLHCEIKKPCKYVEIKEPYKRGFKQKVTTQAKVPCGAWGWKSCTKTKVHYEMVYKTFYKTSYECEGTRKDYPDYQRMKTA